MGIRARVLIQTALYSLPILFLGVLSLHQTKETTRRIDQVFSDNSAIARTARQALVEVAEGAFSAHAGNRIRFAESYDQFTLFMKALAWGTESEVFLRDDGGKLHGDWVGQGWQEKIGTVRTTDKVRQYAGKASLYYAGFSKYAAEALDGNAPAALAKAEEYEQYTVKTLNDLSEAISEDTIAQRNALHRIQDQKMNFSFLLAFDFTLFVAAAGWLFAHFNFVKPLSNLRAEMDRLGRGDLTQPIPIQGQDEIARLAAAFNRMAQDLRKTTVSRDALAREIDERKRLESMVLQSEKMSAVGQLAAGVAHEINNPLGVILGFAQGVLRKVEPGDPVEMPLKSIEREAVRCKQLVQDLLAFSRAGKAGMEETALPLLIESSLSLVQPQAKVNGVEVVQDVEPQLPGVWANKNQLQQVIVNLCSNALDAMPRGGTLTLRARTTTLETRPAVGLEVEDTGTGIPAEIQARVFEPFFTTKEVGKGTGLGLSLVYEIVQRHNGRIQLDSRPGEGTRFRVLLPAAPGPEAPGPAGGGLKGAS